MYAAQYTVTPYGVAIPRVVIDVPAKRDVRLPSSPWEIIHDAEVILPAYMIDGGRG
ncbi:hypothetical protein [Loktanella sp. R86503]|uniref:hypothetical protein n=1 Tax=Loktanella sp. R86503 TaxID=3093847 RepID=UPI0036DB9F0D